MLSRANLIKQDFPTIQPRVWKHRLTFTDSLAWNQFIKEDFDRLKLGSRTNSSSQDYPDEGDDSFEFFLFSLNNFQLGSIRTRSTKECERIMQECRTIVDTY